MERGPIRRFAGLLSSERAEIIASACELELHQINIDGVAKYSTDLSKLMEVGESRNQVWTRKNMLSSIPVIHPPDS